MTRPSQGWVVGCWAFTLACCMATLVLGYNVIAALAVSGLLSLFQPSSAASKQIGNEYLLLALLPSAVAVLANVFVLWGRKPATPGVSPWWVVPSLAVAAGTLAFGTYVCVDVWEVRPEPSRQQRPLETASRAAGQTITVPTPNGDSAWAVSAASTRASKA